MNPQAIPTVSNTTCTLADTEYSVTIQASYGFEFQARTEAIVRFAFATGKVATPTAPYMTLKAGDYFYSKDCGPVTLYIASPVAGTVVEVIAWS